MKILKIFNCLLFTAIFSVTTNAQLVKLTAPNLLTETDVYQNVQGVMYADEVKFGFNKKMLNMTKGEAIVNIRNIMHSGFRNALSELNRKYGNFTIIKVNPNIQ